MRTPVLLGAVAVAVFVLAATAASGSAAAPPREAAGSARIDPPGGGNRVFRFTARRTSGGAATGWATVEYASGLRLRMTISCMRVVGKRALFAGTIRTATVRAQIGRSAVFAVEDGGKPEKDLVTLVYIADRGERPYTCASFPPGMVLLKPTKGAVRIGASTAESA
jgi:hypothetical protein